MKTEISNELIEYLMARAREYDNAATLWAIGYAQTDDKTQQVAYKHKIEMAGVLRDAVVQIAPYLHRLEELIPEVEASHASL